MKKLFEYLKDYKKETILGPFFKLLEAIFDLIVPVIVSLIIDNGILKNNNSYVVKMCLLLIMLAILGIIVSIIAQYFAAKASVGLGSKLRKKLFEHIQKFSFKDLDSIGESTIINRITNDTFQVQNGVNLLLRLALRSPFIVFGSLISAFFIDFRAGLIFIAIIPIICLVIFVITKICVPKHKEIQERKDNLLNITKENLSGARVIRAFGIENDEYKEFEKENYIYTKLQKSTSKITSLMSSLNYIIINLGIIAIIALGGKEVNSGIISQGQVIALYNYMSQILIELIKLTNLLLIIPKTFASIKRIEDIFNIKNLVEDGEELLDNQNISLEFENVSLNYLGENSENTLSNISFKVKNGETLGIIGSTGSGKSSIVNLIPRFYDPSSGIIKINGKDLKECNLENLRRNIGMVMQNKVLFRGTIEENIKFGNHSIEETDIDKALRISQSKEFVINRENGIKEYVEENGKNFSGGQKQRLTIARAVARNSKILIFDDSMSALDLVTDKKLREELNQIKQDKLLILVSQRISTIKDLDKILVIDDGKIVGQGKHEELINNCAVYKEIFESQVKEG